mmetsp:Transcript_10283/g.27300  ORF Transcript_10283/g.27300 Transcript_10283/m.27300 type:complete len:190 (-) Transcript_10283:57-626(-)
MGKGGSGKGKGQAKKMEQKANTKTVVMTNKSQGSVKKKAAPAMKKVVATQKWGKGGGPRRLFSDLPEEKQQKIIGRWAVRAEREGRSPVGGGTYRGVVVWRCKSYGWIRPAAGASLPKKVKDAMATMTAEFRSKAEENDGDSERFAEDVLYFRVCDRGDIEAKIDKEMEVKFKVYTDSKGAGAMEVAPA